MSCPIGRPVASTTVADSRSSRAPMGPIRDKTVPQYWWWHSSHRWEAKR